MLTRRHCVKIAPRLLAVAEDQRPFIGQITVNGQNHCQSRRRRSPPEATRSPPAISPPPPIVPSPASHSVPSCNASIAGVGVHAAQRQFTRAQLGQRFYHPSRRCRFYRPVRW